MKGARIGIGRHRHQSRDACCSRDRCFDAVRRPGQIGRVTEAIFGSDVICDYLDTLHDGRRLIPQEGEPRWRALRAQSVAQGMADAGIAVRWETVRRPEHLRFPRLGNGYVEKLTASYDWLEREFDFDTEINVGHIALATVLSWLEFRDLPSFRGHARLGGWLDQFGRERPVSDASAVSS